MLGKKELDARFGARALDSEQESAVETIRGAVRALATKLDKAVPDGRDKSLALTALEDVEMRAVKGISRGEETPPAATAPAATPKAHKAEQNGEQKIDLRTKEGRALKAAQQAQAGEVSTAAAGRPRSRRAAADAS